MTNVDEPGAIPMFVDRQRVFINQNDHTWLVIHKTASGGTAQDIASFFANDPAMASTHYIVGQDGTIVQCVAEVDGAAGNCCLETGHASFLPLGINLNVKTVSIEHVDPTSDNSTPLTEAQKQASFKLVRDICQRHNIPMRRGGASGGIIGHNDIAPLSRTHCPGNYPWDELFAYLEGETMAIDINSPGVAEHFTEVNANHWTCKSNSKVLQMGILDFYKAQGGLQRLGLPVSNEIALDASGNTRQHFERGALLYDPQHKYDNPPGSGSVYYAHIYTGPCWTAVTADLNAQITTLTSQLAQAKAAPTNDAAMATLKQIAGLSEPYK